MKKIPLAALMLIVAAADARAQTPVGALPSAETLITRFTAAIGGPKLLEIASLRETGTFELPQAGLAGTLEILRAQPNKSVVRVSLPEIGEVVRGYDGKVGYSMNPIVGNVLLAGSELQTASEEALFTSILRAPQLFTARETLEKTTMGGEECYKVKLVWKSGRTMYDCYSVASGLLVGNIVTHESPQGAVEVVTTLGDYKTFGDIKLATKVTQSLMGQDQVVTITNVEFDRVPDSAFALPPEIRALIP